MFDDKVSSFLNRELARINDHVPRKRVSLKEALTKETEYISRNGQKYYIDSKEIEIIKDVCPKHKWGSVMLPIIILRNRELGEGTYAIAGEVIDEYVIMRILELTKDDWETYLKSRKGDSYLYRPHVIKLRRILPTATTIAFV